MLWQPQGHAATGKKLSTLLPWGGSVQSAKRGATVQGGSVVTRIRVIEYDDGLATALDALNARLAAAGGAAFFPHPPDPCAKPPRFHQGLKEIRYLAVEECPVGSGGQSAPAVRGAYALKFQPFWLSGEIVEVADFMLPISEGIIDRAYAQVATRLLLDAVQRQPLLYGLGMGGFDQAVARFLGAAGWQMFSVPFFFLVVRPFRFLRNIVHLRDHWLRKTALDVAAFSGCGWLAAAPGSCFAAQRACQLEHPRGDCVRFPGVERRGLGGSPAALRHVLHSATRARSAACIPAGPRASKGSRFCGATR